MLRRPLVEALLGYEARQRVADLEQFRFEQLMYSVGAYSTRPKVPRSLEVE